MNNFLHIRHIYKLKWIFTFLHLTINTEKLNSHPDRHPVNSKQ